MRAFVSLVCTVAVMGSASVVAAQGKGGAPKVKSAAPITTHAAGTTATRGKSATIRSTGARPKTATKTTMAHGGGRTTAGAAHGGGHAKASSVKAAGSGKSARTATTATAPSTTASTAVPGTTDTSQTLLTPVQQKLQRNTNLASKLQSRLPAGTDVTKAAAGFRNLGQFVAAVNVSNKLGLSFTTLKTAMVTDGQSLGQAIQAQKGTTVDASAEATRAQADADMLIHSTETAARKQKRTPGGRS